MLEENYMVNNYKLGMLNYWPDTTSDHLYLKAIYYTVYVASLLKIQTGLLFVAVGSEPDLGISITCYCAYKLCAKYT